LKSLCSKPRGVQVKNRPGCSRRCGLPPHLCYRTGHETFASRAAELLSIQAVVTPHLRWVQVSAPQSLNLLMTVTWRVRFQNRAFVKRSVFTTSETCATLAPAASAGVGPLLIQYPVFPYTRPTSAYPSAIPKALAS